MDAHEILQRPVITEKTTALANPEPSRRRGNNPAPKYTFRVAREANKIQIREAVETRFNVKVLAVNVMTMRSRAKGIGLKRGMIPGWKKAIVTLAPGQRIEDFFGSV